MKKILYFDMDGVLVDFQTGIDRLEDSMKSEYEGRLDEVPGIFGLMDPLEGAISAFTQLSEHFDVYILSTAPWDNSTAWIDKIEWVKKHLPELAYKRLILSHNKHLNEGHYLIDDRLKNGADRFKGEHIHFGQNGYEDWGKVLEYMMSKK